MIYASLHTPAKDLEHEGGSVGGQETDTGIYDDLSQDCRDGRATSESNREKEVI